MRRPRRIRLWSSAALLTTAALLTITASAQRPRHQDLGPGLLLRDHARQLHPLHRPGPDRVLQ